MRHLHAGRKLGVDQSHRIALLRSLTLALIEHEAIKTTTARAKELRWYADRIVTLAKRGDLSARRRMVQLLGSTQNLRTGENRVRMAIERVYEELVPRFQTRPGGYTQIIRIATRRAGDNTEMCLIRYLPPADEKKAGAKGKAPAKKDFSASKKKPEAKEAAAPQDKDKAKRKPEKPHEDRAPQDKESDKKVAAKGKKKEKEG